MQKTAAAAGIFLKLHSNFFRKFNRKALSLSIHTTWRLIATCSMQGNGENNIKVSNCYNTNNKVRIWSPQELINGHNTLGNGYACLVLNRSVQVQPKVIKRIWQNAQIRCLVDGGANHWREFLQKHCTNEELKRPQYVTGDFDSITQETRDYFKDSDIEYKHTPDQNETDFTKALRFLKSHMESQNICEVIVLQENTGRIDQIMANINTLYKLQSDALNICLLSSACISWLLLPGKHTIIVPQELVECQRWCALMPVGCKANAVTTTGLKWNLSQTPLEFGNMVSTSNTYASEEVNVETDRSLVWSMGL